jgi:hypothetical protein
MLGSYLVSYGECADRHYIKNFKKKYKHQWDITNDAITALCARIDNLLGTATCDTIKCVDTKVLAKLDFAVAGTKESPKNSGCRAILVVDQEARTVEVLLVYHKHDIEHINKQETLAWRSLLSDLYPEYRTLL